MGLSVLSVVGPCINSKDDSPLKMSVMLNQPPKAPVRHMFAHVDPSSPGGFFLNKEAFLLFSVIKVNHLNYIHIY